ncbi:FmdB family zinc ribbon protein [Mariprofundus ferrooxydans]|uniref:FmdB family zinc ribbon protein n=1 Tax=Mariprofundus ferrooxydans TaxID=314344 RepID=UPI0003712109|nr:zinc ribbon domain-containing protein [Mariprofundus ferrooxydans]
MPIYEFRCKACDRTFETLVRNSREQVVCKHCGSSELQKMISAHTIGNGTSDTACGSPPCSPTPACGGGGCPAGFS